MLGRLLLPDFRLLKDDLSDEIGAVLAAVADITTMTAAKKALIVKARAMMEHKGYLTYTGRYLAMDAGTHSRVLGVGDSCCMDVPQNKRGNLEPFRGKFIRIACVASGKGSSKVYMAGVRSRKRAPSRKPGTKV